MLGNVVKEIMLKVGFEGHSTNTHFDLVVPHGCTEQVIRKTTGHQSCDGKSSTLERKVKEENKFKTDVKQQTQEMGLSETVFQEKQNEDYNQSVEIIKIVILYK